MSQDKASVCDDEGGFRLGERWGNDNRPSTSSACPDAREQSAPLMSTKKTFGDRERDIRISAPELRSPDCGLQVCESLSVCQLRVK